MGVVGLVATGNPAGLIVSTGMKGRAKQTAKEIADVLKKRFEEQGWIN